MDATLAGSIASDQAMPLLSLPAPLRAETGAGGLPLAPGHGKALRGPQRLHYKAPMHV